MDDKSNGKQSKTKEKRQKTPTEVLWDVPTSITIVVGSIINILTKGKIKISPVAWKVLSLFFIFLVLTATKEYANTYLPIFCLVLFSLLLIELILYNLDTLKEDFREKNTFADLSRIGFSYENIIQFLETNTTIEDAELTKIIEEVNKLHLLNPKIIEIILDYQNLGTCSINALLGTSEISTSSLTALLVNNKNTLNREQAKKVLDSYSSNEDVIIHCIKTQEWGREVYFEKTKIRDSKTVWDFARGKYTKVIQSIVFFAICALLFLNFPYEWINKIDLTQRTGITLTLVLGGLIIAAIFSIWASTIINWLGNSYYKNKLKT